MKHIFGHVANPLEAGVGINPNNPLDHPKSMVGIGAMPPLEKVLELAKRMNPRLKRIGLPWNPSQSNSQTYTRLARKTVFSLGVELLEGSVDSTPAMGADDYEVGRQIGDLTARVLGGEDMNRIPIIYSVPKLTVINRSCM